MDQGGTIFCGILQQVSCFYYIYTYIEQVGFLKCCIFTFPCEVEQLYSTSRLNDYGKRMLFFAEAYGPFMHGADSIKKEQSLEWYDLYKMFIDFQEEFLEPFLESEGALITIVRFFFLLRRASSGVLQQISWDILHISAP